MEHDFEGLKEQMKDWGMVASYGVELIVRMRKRVSVGAEASVPQIDF